MLVVEQRAELDAVMRKRHGNAALERGARCVRSHRLDTNMASDLIGLYVDPPAHAAVFCVDEKSAIQALGRRNWMLPLSPLRRTRRG